jgi:DNA-binding transcriptional ArsR family regulator
VPRNSKQGSGTAFAGGALHPAAVAGAAAAGLGTPALHRPVPGYGDAELPARKGVPLPLPDATRDAGQKNVPPETPARIARESPEIPARPKGKRSELPGEGLETCSSPPAPVNQKPPSGSHAGFFFSLFGFRRIRKKNVLENEYRKAVFQGIAEAPGIDAISLSRKLGMNINTLRYHLAKLLETDKITYLSRPGTVRYYLNQGMFSPKEQILFHYLSAGTAGQIIRFVSEHPGASRKELAEALAISGPSVTRHIQEISSDGIIRNEPEGKTNHYYLAEETAVLLKKFQRVMGEDEGGGLPAPV